MNSLVAERSAPRLFVDADDTHERRLSESYAPCLMLALQLRAAQHFGDTDVLRRRIKDLLDRAERDALRSGKSSREVEHARFALVAFLDETILTSEWPQKAHWMANPLQLDLYDRYDAGEAFFTRLDELRARPSAHAEVLEVYYLCLTLGFKGQYQLHGQEQLRTLIEETHAQLSRMPGFGSGVLAPHGTPRDQITTEVRSKLPVWVLLVCAVTVGLLVYFGMHLYISNIARDVAFAIDQITAFVSN